MVMPADAARSAIVGVEPRAVRRDELRALAANPRRTPTAAACRCWRRRAQTSASSSASSAAVWQTRRIATSSSTNGSAVAIAAVRPARRPRRRWPTYSPSAPSPSRARAARRVVRAGVRRRRQRRRQLPPRAHDDAATSPRRAAAAAAARAPPRAGPGPARPRRAAAARASRAADRAPPRASASVRDEVALGRVEIADGEVDEGRDPRDGGGRSPRRPSASVGDPGDQRHRAVQIALAEAIRDASRRAPDVRVAGTVGRRGEERVGLGVLAAPVRDARQRQRRRAPRGRDPAARAPPPAPRRARCRPRRAGPGRSRPRRSGSRGRRARLARPRALA